MKDQASVGKESASIKYDRALALFTESVMKPDHDLRGCSHNQGCYNCLLYTSPSPRDKRQSRMPSSA